MGDPKSVNSLDQESLEENGDEESKWSVESSDSEWDVGDEENKWSVGSADSEWDIGDGDEVVTVDF